ncbi:MAG: VWA domain-containing protein [Caldilineae bacterium]|nr:MAG: VWA domain-containing protein [Caldilineae bacterium]
MSPLPGGALASRPLHFIWIADCSGSMGQRGKIQALNNAIREAIPSMQQVAAENPNAQVLVRAVKFSNGAQWHVAHPTPMDQFRWEDLEADGVTDMGKALQLVADALHPSAMPPRALPPVLVLISDGKPTDDYKAGLRALMEQPWGKKAVRIAIAIGDDADKDMLQRFMGHPELEPLEAHNAESLVRYIKWVSTAVLQSASSPASQTVERAAHTNVPLPPAPEAAPDVDDVW